MSSVFRRPEDVLREMRGTVISVEDPAVEASRRARSVAAMRSTQRAALVRHSQRVVWRRRVVALGFVLVPSGALAAAWLESTARNGARAETRTESTTSEPSRNGSKGAAATPAPTPSIAVPEATKDAVAEPKREDQRSGPKTKLPHAERRQALQTESSAAEAKLAIADFPPASTLAIENALMQSGMAAARNGDDARAVVLFDELLNRYPMSPLVAGARVERLRSIARRDGTNNVPTGTATP